MRDTLSDGQGGTFRLEPPRAVPAVPKRGFEERRSLYVAPPRHGAGVDLEIAPDSERLQPLEAWPPWDGRDLLEMPLLIKTRGKTTTDQISPAGAWLRYRGHLERFSDNLLSGATDAFSGRTRPGLADEARDLRARGLRWVIVGDANYGEGSSREHAALSPRLLGCGAVIARSFARIHESNLKKQGILALTFQHSADYAEIHDGDVLSLVGLAELAENRSVECVVAHVDGSTTRLALQHSYTETQLEWFRAGSALGAIRRKCVA